MRIYISMRTNKKALLILCVCLLTPSCHICDARQINLRSLETNNVLKVVWSVTNIRMDDNNRGSNVIGAPNRIIINGWKIGAIPTGTIIGLDSTNGDTVWTVPNGTNSDKIIAQDEVLYRGTSGIATVQSYNVENGELLWQRRLPLAHSTSDLYFADHNIFVDTNNDKFFTLNESGEILDSLQETDRIFLAINNILFLKGNYDIEAVELTSRNKLWKLEIADDYTYAPIFENGTIFLRTWSIPTFIYSIDQVTGNVNWKVSNKLLSNLYIQGEKMYFISSDGYLVVIDKYSGNEILRVKFSPEFDLNKQNGGYFIAGDPTNNVLAVSFGDNAQILGLKILDP
jgi:outer membrane protein assembly factor BamB